MAKKSKLLQLQDH